MKRFEENKMVIDVMLERAEQHPTGTYEEMVVFQLGAIAIILMDISKSLAILADDKTEWQKNTFKDKTESEGET